MELPSGRISLITAQRIMIVLLILNINRGWSFFMLSRTQIYTMNPGETVDLDCEFFTKYFNLFNNPVLWTKVQLNEHSRVNIMSNINHPFVTAGRFKVVFLPSPPKYRLVLTISNVSMEDSANYTCEVRGAESSVLGIVEHLLFVKGPVTDLLISQSNCSDSCGSGTTEVSFTENDPSFLQCVAIGGSPPPEVRIYIDDFDITYRFTSDISTQLEGTVGLRVMQYSVYTRTVYLVVAANDDGKQLRCTAAVTGSPTNVTIATMRINYAPIITCESGAAYENARHAHVTCEIKSRPTVTNIFWVVDGYGTIVSGGSLVGDYWTLIQHRSDGAKEGTLHINSVKAEYFRKYTIVAENIIGQSSKEVELMRIYRSGANKNRDYIHYTDENMSQGHGDYKHRLAQNQANRTSGNYDILITACLFHFMVTPALV